MNDDEVTIWLKGMTNESPLAIEQVWNAYYEKLVRYARRKLGDAPRRDADEEDVAISAMNSFYRGAKAGRFPKLDDRDDLWKLLLTITARKAKKRIRYNMTEKRGAGAVRGESVFGQPDEGRIGLGEVLGNEPSPELADQVVDQCSELLDQLNDARLNEIAIMRLEGYTNEEIASHLDCAVRTVERKIMRIRDIWESQEHSSDSES